MADIRYINGRPKQHIDLLTDEGTPTGIGVFVPMDEILMRLPPPQPPRKRRKVGNVIWLWPVLWG